jgi:hypothetical protein
LGGVLLVPPVTAQRYTTCAGLGTAVTKGRHCNTWFCADRQCSSSWCKHVTSGTVCQCCSPCSGSCSTKTNKQAKAGSATLNETCVELYRLQLELQGQTYSLQT